MKAAQVVEHIVQWLTQYCDTASLKGFVTGVSGGIDSAVTSTLCARTGKTALLLNMPIYQAAHQIDLARTHIQWVEERFPNAKGVHVDLTPAFQSMEQTLPDAIQDGLTMANSRSRLRMTTLYAFSTHHRLLVAGTGNKVEDFGVGFYTKYGDGGVDLSPIADLTKSEVYALGRELGIIDGILQAPPTDGLWEDNRTDEGQIGASYPELEWAMRFTDENGDEGGLDTRQREVLTIYRRFNQTNRHKMEAIPVCHIPNDLKA
jgi:NAD+ synthase